MDDKKSEQLQNARRVSDAELSIVALLLQDNKLLANVSLSADDFESHLTRSIFTAVRTLADQGRVAEHIAVADYLEKIDPSVSWLAEIIDLSSNSIARSEYVETYVGIVRESKARRAAEKIGFALMSTSKDGVGAIDRAISELMALSNQESSRDFDARAVVKAAIAKTEDAFERSQDGRLVGLSTGLNELNQITGGWHDSDLVILPARPAMGKTAAMLNFCLSADVPFGIISSEQAFDQIGQRLLSIAGRVPGSAMRDGTLQGAQWDALSLGARTLLERAFWINDDPTITIDGIRRQARQWKHKNGIKLLAVDYVQRIYPTDPRAPKHIQVEEIVRGLKSLAKELAIPIIALAQVNRDCEKRDDKRPRMGDIADASAIEKEADLVVTLYRDEVYNGDTDLKGVAELEIVKNRHGVIGTVFANWDGSTFSLSNYLAPGRAYR